MTKFCYFGLFLCLSFAINALPLSNEFADNASQNSGSVSTSTTKVSHNGYSLTVAMTRESGGLRFKKTSQDPSGNTKTAETFLPNPENGKYGKVTPKSISETKNGADGKPVVSMRIEFDIHDEQGKFVSKQVFHYE